LLVAPEQRQLTSRRRLFNEPQTFPSAGKSNTRRVKESKMSKEREIPAVNSPLSAVSDRCKRIADRFRRFAVGIVRSITERRQERQFDVPQAVSIVHENIELKESLKLLRIGDRLRVFCNDGILVVEKVSQTQVKLVQAQTMTEVVH
jgi:hypothetical protein